MDKAKEKATKWKAMPDSELFEYVENRVNKAKAEGRNKAKAEYIKGVKSLLNEALKITDEAGRINISDLTDTAERIING